MLVFGEWAECALAHKPLPNPWELTAAAIPTPKCFLVDPALLDLHDMQDANGTIVSSLHQLHQTTGTPNNAPKPTANWGSSAFDCGIILNCMAPIFSFADVAYLCGSKLCGYFM